MLRRLLLLIVMINLAVAGVALARSGYRIYVVRTGSMSPTIHPGDAVLDRPAPGPVHVGEVVTFTAHTGSDAVITHRVHDVAGTTFHTKGDANATPDNWTVSRRAVQGQVADALRFGGFILVFLHQPEGVAAIVLGLVGCVLAWGIWFPAAEPKPAA